MRRVTSDRTGQKSPKKSDRTFRTTPAPRCILKAPRSAQAASFALAALEARVAGDVLLAADGAPRTRAGIVDAVAAHPLFKDRPRPTFEASDEPPTRGPAGAGKIYDCARSMAAVGWAPAHASIDAFFAADAAAPCEVADRLA